MNYNGFWNCMTFVAGCSASATGCVLLGHNEDDAGRIACRHAWIPAADWPEGTMLPHEPETAAIPQVRHTLGRYWSEVIGPEGGLTAADLFLNEKGVCITSDSASISRESADSATCLTEGGIEYNLRRIVGERAVSAEDGVRIIKELLDRYGYRPSGRIYIVADSREAFLFQIVRGKQYICSRVPDDSVAVIPNHYTIRRLQESSVCFHSHDLIPYALKNGWCTMDEADPAQFDFARTYQNPEFFLHRNNIFRHRFGIRSMTGKDPGIPDFGYPPFVKPNRMISVEDMIHALSDHYENTEYDPRFGPGNSPHDTDVRRICTGSSIESSIIQFSDNPLMTRMWTAYGRPCEQPFIPFHPLCGSLPEIDTVPDPLAAQDQHLHRNSQSLEHRTDGWQILHDFGNSMEFLYQKEIVRVSELKKQIHGDCLSSLEVAESSAASFLPSQIESARTLLHESDRSLAKCILNRIHDFMNSNFHLLVIQAPDILKTDDAVCSLCFHCPEQPDEPTMLFGLGSCNISISYAHPVPGSLVKISSSQYQISFSLSDFLPENLESGMFEFYLGGKTASGVTYAGKTILKLCAQR